MGGKRVHVAYALTRSSPIEPFDKLYPGIQMLGKHTVTSLRLQTISGPASVFESQVFATLLHRKFWKSGVFVAGDGNQRGGGVGAHRR